MELIDTTGLIDIKDDKFIFERHSAVPMRGVQIVPQEWVRASREALMIVDPDKSGQNPTNPNLRVSLSTTTGAPIIRNSESRRKSLLIKGLRRGPWRLLRRG
jgi:hypothetical protein